MSYQDVSLNLFLYQSPYKAQPILRCKVQTLSFQCLKELCRPTNEQAIWRQSAELPLPICAVAPRRYPIQVPFPFQVDACSLFAIWRTKKGTAANDVCKVGNWQIFLQIFIQTSYEEGVEFARPITWLPSYVKDPSDGGGGGGSINRSDLSSVSSASRRN